ncbi:MAG: hypothetical protein LBJ59_12050 [Zoogloeaceae bacterium]|jgi:hypothetical protein|nr:hypothetical protein [Zoogloeaceae bacterium]
MSYIAVSTIRDGKRRIAPGERVSLSAAQAEELLAAGAIREVADAPPPLPPSPPSDGRATVAQAAGEDAAADVAAPDPVPTPKPKKSVKAKE